MSDGPAAAATEGEPKKKGGKGLLIGLVAAVLLGGGSFAAVFLGLIPLGGEPAPAEGEAAAEAHAEADPHAGEEGAAKEAHGAQVAYVPLQSMVISLGPLAKSRHLKLTLQIEVKPEAHERVAAMTPRITDVLQTFLRAVDERDFELPRAMNRLRAQMLRRLQLVTPEGSVRDLLVQEFILD